MMQRNEESAKVIFPKRLKKAISLNGLTQARFAEDMIMTPQAISSYVRGKTTPDYDVLRDISRRLDVSIDFLLGR